MILRSAFSGAQTSMFFSGETTGDITAKTSMQELLHGQMPPSMLVRQDIATHKFLHYNYTMFRCLWGCKMNLKSKVEAFRDITHWISLYNVSLVGTFTDFDDYLAWSIATYVEE